MNWQIRIYVNILILISIVSFINLFVIDGWLGSPRSTGHKDGDNSVTPRKVIITWDPDRFIGCVFGVHTVWLYKPERGH